MPLSYEEVEALLAFKTDPEQLKRIQGQLDLVEYTYKVVKESELHLRAQKLNLRVAVVEANKLGASLKDVAEILDVTRQYVAQLCREGELEHYKRKTDEAYRLAKQAEALGTNDT